MPGMLMNHSCDPTVTDDSHDVCEGEAYATRDIQKGEELTYNYLLQYYDRGPFFDECRCGSANCLGKMTGFKELGDEDKAKYLPLASGAVQAMHKADIVEEPGPKPSEELIVVPRSEESAATGTDTTRLVFPGPSCALAKIEIKQHDNGMHALYAAKDFCFGDRVYEFWTKDWPFGGRGPIDMVASTKLAHGDLPEGTTIHLLPTECAAQKDRSGHYKFSGWDLLVQHSCEPNLAYNDLHEEEDDDWRGAYAVRAITKGEKLTVDFNCILWDRSDSMNADECHCGAAKCVGTMKGFKVSYFAVALPQYVVLCVNFYCHLTCSLLFITPIPLFILAFIFATVPTHGCSARKKDDDLETRLASLRRREGRQMSRNGADSACTAAVACGCRVRCGLS